MSNIDDARARLEAAIAKLPQPEGTAKIGRAMFSVEDVRTLLAASRREPSEALVVEKVDPDTPLQVQTDKGVLVAVNRDGTVLRAPEPSDTDERERLVQLATRRLWFDHATDNWGDTAPQIVDECERIARLVLGVCDAE